MSGIYFHIPFCRQACYYCDFHFSTNRELQTEMVQALARELELRRAYLAAQVKTVYFGGGTPSLLQPSEIAFLLDKVRTLYDVSEDAEVTLEANPDDLDRATLKDLKSVGVNRLSIGIQSFDDAILKSLNRAHDAGMALRCVDTARKVGFVNISIDLIYAIPGQDENLWKKNISTALALQPEHISAYSLTIEDKTVFGRWAAKGKIRAVDDDQTASEFDLLTAMLASAGYEHYEVSNFCLPGLYSRHNSSYWKQQPYLGIGPAAHSYDLASRQFNVPNNHHYLKSINMGAIPATVEILTTAEKINDYLLTTLRTSWGCDLSRIEREHDINLFAVRREYIETLVNNGLAVVNGTTLVLTQKGRFVADKIASDLFVASLS
jgi:oxygen-independent coproporphyrinogen III oxidase